MHVRKLSQIACPHHAQLGPHNSPNVSSGVHVRCVADACLDQAESQGRTEGHVCQSKGDRVGEARVGEDVFIQHNDYGRERDPEDDVAARKFTV